MSETASLVERLRRHEASAWQEIHERYAARLLRYISAKIGASDAEDVLQETMLSALASIEQLRNQQQLAKWLYGIAEHKIIDHWRRDARRQRLLQQTTPACSRLALYEALQTLQSNHRRVLLLRYHVGLDVHEVAQQLQRSYKGTESLLSRAREALRSELQQS